MPGSHGTLPAHPVVSVVIISRNEGPELAATLDNLREEAGEADFEWIVVDDGSVSPVFPLISDLHGLQILRIENRGCPQ